MHQFSLSEFHNTLIIYYYKYNINVNISKKYNDVKHRQYPGQLSKCLPNTTKIHFSSDPKATKDFKKTRLFFSNRNAAKSIQVANMNSNFVYIYQRLPKPQEFCLLLIFS